MKRRVPSTAQRQALVAVCLALAGLYTAPTPADPMRPLLPAAPPAGTPPLPEAPGTPGPAVAATPLPVRRLLAIRQDSNGERMALFGDRWVREGQRFLAPEGDTLVLSISATAIELEQGRVRSLHHLLPPLLPPLWPARPAELLPGAAATTTGPTAPTASLPAPPRAPHSAASAAPRTERP